MKCVGEPDSSKETKPQNKKSIPIAQSEIAQVNIVIIRRGLVQKNILEALT